MKLDLTHLITDYPTVRALAFDPSGQRLAVGAALHVLVYEVISADELRLLSQFPVNDRDDEDAVEGVAIVEKIAFASAAATLLVRLTMHSGTCGFDADRSFDLASGERLSCSLRGDSPDRQPPFAAESTALAEDAPAEVDICTAKRLWTAADGGDELWADDFGLLVRRQPEDPQTTILRDWKDAPDDGLVVTAVSADGQLCARACSDFSAATSSLELFLLADAPSR